MINVITFLVIKEGYITKSKLFFLSLLIVFLITVQSRAEVTVIEEPTPPSITNIKFTPEGDQQVFKTGDSFEISFKVGNMVYETDTTYIKIFDGYPDCTYGVSCDMKDGTFQVTFAGEDFIVAEITEAEINKETGEYRIVVTLKKESTFVYGISSIKVQNGEVSTEKTFTQQAYWFRINNNCATNNHTIKSDTPFETITEPTCTEKGSQGKRCIYCNQIIDETIEDIPTIGHTPSENYETITHATCVSKGSQGKRCTVCEKIIEDTIQETPIDSHWHVGGWTKAETEEYYYAKCNSCGADIYHNWTSIEGIFMDDKELNIGQENGAFEDKNNIPFNNNTSINKQTTQQSTIQINTTTTPVTPTLKSVKNPKKKTITITWGRVADAKGYEVQYALNKKFTKSKKNKTVTKNKIISLTVNKLKKGKTYYVRVRAYNVGSDSKKVFSGWSKVKKVKAKKR